MTKKVAIVVTTIYEAVFLEHYVKNIKKYNHINQVIIVVIPDKKTPATIYEQCAYFRDIGFSVFCPNIEEQDEFLKKFPSMTNIIPYNSDNRRNIGFLFALEKQVDVLISIDDDNYCIENYDFVAEHSIVGTPCSEPVVESSDQWFNVCTLLKSEISEEIFPRGFPYYARKKSRDIKTHNPVSHHVAMNAGLWLNDPDVDAVTRLALSPKINDVDTISVLLAPNTWSPVNTQNTAISRQAVAAYYYVRMGYPVGGMMIDRYGDILSGFFCQKCVKTRGEYVRIGSPVADHRRTTHNLFKDLYHELAGMVIIEELIPFLMDVRIDGASYIEAYCSLSDVLKEQSHKFKGFVWDQGGREFLIKTAENMLAWVEAVKIIG